MKTKTPIKPKTANSTKANVIKSVCAMCEKKKELKSENLCKECFDSLP